MIAWVEDLMFLSRIRAAAPGSKVAVVLEPAALLEACRRLRDPLVLVDLDCVGRDAVPAIRALRREPDLEGVSIVGFVSHVEVERAGAAREAGISRILARSAFVRELPGMLARESPGTIA